MGVSASTFAATLRQCAFKIISVHVESIAVSDRIRLHEARQPRRIHAGFVVVQAERCQPCLPRVTEPRPCQGTEVTIWCVLVAAEARTSVVGECHDRT